MFSFLRFSTTHSPRSAPGWLRISAPAFVAGIRSRTTPLPTDARLWRPWSLGAPPTPLPLSDPKMPSPQTHTLSSDPHPLLRPTPSPQTRRPFLRPLAHARPLPSPAHLIGPYGPPDIRARSSRGPQRGVLQTLPALSFKSLSPLAPALEDPAHHVVSHRSREITLTGCIGLL